MKYSFCVDVNSAVTGMILEIKEEKKIITPDNFNDTVSDRFNGTKGDQGIIISEN